MSDRISIPLINNNDEPLREKSVKITVKLICMKDERPDINTDSAGVACVDCSL